MRMPIAAVIQIEAAVVSPRTDRPSFMMTPAPRKPMPVMMPCAMRVGSTVRTRAAGIGDTQCDSYTVTSISRLDARHTRAWVRKPAGAAAVAALQADQPAGDQRGEQAERDLEVFLTHAARV